jgi:RimJ/RimL family protein N-acetyltransferase
VVPVELTTTRLRLRRWRDSDLEPFAAMNADPKVMEFYPDLYTRPESDAMVARIEDTFADRGFGLWAVEIGATGAFAGYVGLSSANFDAPFTPAVEIGWRLAHPVWGQGYATEAARAAARDGFERVGLGEIVSFTSAINARSRRVMEKLGMTRGEAEDFEHPSVPAGHPLRRHVLYRLPTPQPSVDR